MPENALLTHAHLKTPKAAAIAGIAFSLLLLSILWLMRTSIPADPLEPGAWLGTDTRAITIALNLVPFAGVAFLWFIGVLRDRLGQREDRFFHRLFWECLVVSGDAVRRRCRNWRGCLGRYHLSSA